MKSGLTYTVRDLRALLKKRTVYVLEWKYRNRVYTPRRFIARAFRWRATKPGQGAGWMEAQIGIKRQRWIMILVDTDLEIK